MSVQVRIQQQLYFWNYSVKQSAISSIWNRGLTYKVFICKIVYRIISAVVRLEDLLQVIVGGGVWVLLMLCNTSPHVTVHPSLLFRSIINCSVHVALRKEVELWLCTAMHVSHSHTDLGFQALSAFAYTFEIFTGSSFPSSSTSPLESLCCPCLKMPIIATFLHFVAFSLGLLGTLQVMV